MVFSSTTNIGLVRNENQDALGHLKIDSGELFIICDGVGGLPSGALASKTAVDSILSDFTSDSKEQPEIRLQTAMNNAQNAVMNTNPKPLGTTAAVLYLHEGTAFTGWCGDSRIYHFRGHNIRWMSRDHNVLHDILNKGQSKGNIFFNPQELNFKNSNFIKSYSHVIETKALLKNNNGEYFVTILGVDSNFVSQFSEINIYEKDREDVFICSNKIFHTLSLKTWWESNPRPKNKKNSFLHVY